MDPSKLYIEMCRRSPVQKEWKPNNGDILYGELTKESFILVGCKPNQTNTEIHGQNRIWIARQEDWQNRYGLFVVKNAASLDKIDMTGGNLSEYVDVDSVVQSTDLNDIRNFNNIRWCVFYHKEVLGLVWDFDKSRWVKNG